MSKHNYTEIVCIIDRSGSMGAIKDDAIGGFNNFLESQKKLPGEASISLILFDHEYLMPIQNADLMSVEPLTEKTYAPRGTTALLDAVGKTINNLWNRLANMTEQERPDRVIVCILTDGYENASHEFSRSKIKEMIEYHQEKYQWQFLFLAANQDAFAEGAKIGIPRRMAYQFESTEELAAEAYVCMNKAVASIRMDGREKE